uniref:Uncharacterized protein n=1 Tax=Knipowitschia caucasica TaxID=637954 RepID=A0AAV2KEI2_KNICA
MAAMTRLVKKLGLDHAAVAYSMTTLGSCMINNIFSFYYVKLFLNKYKISEGAFHQSQLVYMIWNAVNDPLFGYLQDNSKVPCCSKRRLSILYGAPLYSLAFLLAWFPWRSYSPVRIVCRNIKSSPKSPPSCEIQSGCFSHRLIQHPLLWGDI